MKYNPDTPLLVKIFQIVVWNWQNRRQRRDHEKEMQMWRIRIRAEQRAGCYVVMREETRRTHRLSTDNLRAIVMQLDKAP